MNRGLKVRIYDAYSISSSNGRSYYGPSPSMNIFMQKLYLRISFYSRHTQPSSNAPSLLAKLICNREFIRTVCRKISILQILPFMISVSKIGLQFIDYGSRHFKKYITRKNEFTQKTGVGGAEKGFTDPF